MAPPIENLPAAGTRAHHSVDRTQTTRFLEGVPRMKYHEQPDHDLSHTIGGGASTRGGSVDQRFESQMG